MPREGATDSCRARGRGFQSVQFRKLEVLLGLKPGGWSSSLKPQFHWFRPFPPIKWIFFPQPPGRKPPRSLIPTSRRTTAG